MAIEQGNMCLLTGSFYNHDEKDECLLSSYKLFHGHQIIFLNNKEVKGGPYGSHCLHSGFF